MTEYSDLTDNVRNYTETSTTVLSNAVIQPFIESIDTSNPIIHGLEGVQYNSLGLLTKSSTKIDQIDKEINRETRYNINHNLIRFKQFIQDGNTQLY